MKRLKMRGRIVLIAAAMTALVCQGVQAKGVNADYTQVNGEVAKGARAKYTKLKGKGKDTVTVMVYMIGSDLESQSGMATADLNEMLYAGINNKNVNVIVQTGGAKRWKNSVMNAKKVQRWTITGKGIGLLEENKSTPMTDEEQLADFIQYCTKKAPADRNILIFWDHGGGSVSGYGHDELYPNDTMNIGEIARALKTCGKKFDFIGFDTCLMATLETAIAIEPYADYMIASEESEPGTGWYYTNWLKLLSDNSSTNTLNLGRQICDDFTTKNAMYARTLGTTLSVTDLGELGGIVEARLGAFGSGLTTQLQSKDYQTVATARTGSREFAASSRLDQVDLVDFCTRLGSKSSKQLADAVKSAVKYNRVNNVTNAYGLSIYFPNSSLKSVNSMIQICEDIGIEDSWMDGIRTYATLEQSGQIVANNGYAYGSGSGSLLDVLLGSGGSGSGSYNYTSGAGSSAGGGSFLDALFSDASAGSYSSSSSTGGLLEALLGSSGQQTQSQSGSGLLEALLGTSTQQPQSSGSGSLLEALFGSSGSGSSGYNSYNSYGSMSEQDILNLLMQAYGQSGNTYNAYNNSSYGSSASGLMDLLTGGYASTSGNYYGVNDYSSIYGNANYGNASDNSLLGLAAEMLFGRAMVGSETLELTEKDGQQVLVLDEDMWDQITEADLNVFVDDGEGYIDLGLDNVLQYNDDGDLIDEWDGTWLTLNGQPVAVYPISDEDADDNGLYITTKFIPVLLDGERVNLIVEFNEETGIDSVLGAQEVLPTGVVGKGYVDLAPGSEIQPVCDYFTYDGTFESQYKLGDPVIVPDDGELTIANMTVTGGDRMLYTARLTDIYQAHYWLPMTEAESGDAAAAVETEAEVVPSETEAEAVPSETEAEAVPPETEAEA